MIKAAVPFVGTAAFFVGFFKVCHFALKSGAQEGVV